MKVLTPNELKNTKDTQLAKDILRTRAVKDVRVKEEANLNEIEARFEVSLTNQRVRWSKEEQAMQNKVRALTLEIKNLEEKRDELNIPIQIKEERAKIMLEEASKTLADAKLKESDNLETAELLESKLDDVSEREQDCLEKEAKLSFREQNIVALETTTSALAKELSIKWEEYFKEKEAHDTKVIQENQLLDLTKINQEQKQLSLDDREKALFNFKRQLDDDRASIEKYLKNEQRQARSEPRSNDNSST